MSVTEAAGPGGSTTVTESGSPVGIGSYQVQSWTDSNEAVLQSATGGSACSWKPPVQDLSGPLHPGDQWTTSSTCTQQLGDGSGTVTITIVEADEVVGAAQASVASQPTQVWVIERHQTATEQGPTATVTTETATSDMFAPTLGVVVYEVSRTAYPTSSGSTAYVTTVSELISSQH
jgi:hypothetical protein